VSASSSAVGSAPVQIAEVEVATPGERLHGHLDRPGLGDPELGFCIPVSGWALSRDSANVAIEIRQGRQLLRRFARGIERPDIARAFTGVPGAQRSGFLHLLDAVKLPPAFELQVSGIVDGTDVEPLARVRGSRRAFEPLPMSSPAHPAPLMVTTLGRSGSTLLMTLLSAHPQVVAFQPATYDSRPFAYQLDAAIGMASPASRMRLLDSGTQGEAWWLGRASLVPEELMRIEEPLRELLLGGAPVERLLRSAVDQAASFADDLAAAQERTDVRYAAEKCGPGYLPRLTRELCADGREIFLVRDFRDVLASMLAFNAKRGYAAFGREHVDSDERFVQWQATIAALLAAGWRERREGALLVRYEELVADLPAGLARILDYLELDAAPSLLTSVVDQAQAQLNRIQHRTTPNVSASSGRWQTDLPPALKELANEAFADPLQEFGYS
jgi:Sulfotransferase family